MLDTMHRDTALDFEPGVIRLFGEADIGQRGMISGWSQPEAGHAWNDGQEAVYQIAVRPPIGRFDLTILGEPYISRARPFQEMTLFGNGYRIASWRMRARTETRLNVTLEPEWWFTRNRRHVMKLLFHMPTSARPNDLNDGQDGRELCFCFRSIYLRRLPG